MGYLDIHLFVIWVGVRNFVKAKISNANCLGSNTISFKKKKEGCNNLFLTFVRDSYFYEWNYLIFIGCKLVENTRLSSQENRFAE